MAESKVDSLEQKLSYSGSGISVQSLEESISGARGRQNEKLGDLKQLREKNSQLQASLTEEVKKLRKFSDYLTAGKIKGGFWAKFKEIMSYIPGLKRLSITQRSIEELLKQQYEISKLRVGEAAEFADKLRAAQEDLYDEIGRLNNKIVESAKNEEVAADFLLQLQNVRKEYEDRVKELEAGSAESREVQAELDKARKLMAQHSTQLQLYHTAEERLARLKENTNMLAETIGNLYSDITQYVTAVSEKLDLVQGQLTALGTAADASMVMLDLKQSMDVLTESMNATTKFVSETQIYFRQNLDRLMDELELYDDQTRQVMQKNLEISRAIEEDRIAGALEVARARKEEPAGGPEASPQA